MKSEASTTVSTVSCPPVVTNTSIYEFRAQRRPPNYRWREELLRLEGQKKMAEQEARFWYWTFVLAFILSVGLLVCLVVR